MGEWVIGAFINLIGSIAINFGTNLLKLGHDQRERLSMLDTEATNGKIILKPIIYFQTWRVGILFFSLGNCLNFISFGYAAQSLLAALGSIQFVSNIAFAYFVLNKRVTVKVLVATAFIVLGNVFLVAFGNHQSPVYTPEQLAEKYSNIVFLLYCLVLILIVTVHHYIYRRGELLLSFSGHELSAYWHMLLPFSYAIVSGAVGSCSVLFAKSLSNLLRLAMSSGYQLHSLFTYSMLLLFLSTAGFWMARLNEGLSMFDAILIVPMFQIAWTFFSICTGFVYFQEYQVLDALRITMFIIGMLSVFIGISLLAPDESKGVEGKDSSLASSMSPSIATDVDRLVKLPSEVTETEDLRSFGQAVVMKLSYLLVKAKTACTLMLGLGEDSISASSVLVMPMVSSRMTGFRGTGLNKSKFSFRNPGWSKISMTEDDAELLETSSMLSHSHADDSGVIQVFLFHNLEKYPDSFHNAEGSLNNGVQNEKQGLIPVAQHQMQAMASKGYETLNKAKESVDEKYSQSEKGRLLSQWARMTILAAEEKAGRVREVATNNVYFAAGASWVSGVLDKAGKRAAQFGSWNKREHLKSRKQK